MAIKPVYYYPPREEKINVVSHGFGAIMTLVGTVLLLVKAYQLGSSPLHFWSYLIYGLSTFTLYCASTLYHASKNDKQRRRLNIFDHSAIYVLIAGTYVPYMLLGMDTAWGIPMVITTWSVALVGIVFKFFFTGRFKMVSTLGYVLMGGMVVLAIRPMQESMPQGAISYIFLGGAAYIIGAVLYTFKIFPYNHASFHVLVLIGTFLHFLGVYLYL